MNIGKIFLKSTFVPSVLARFVRTKASTSVIGMMASVRVSLDGHGLVERLAAESVERVPCGGRSCDGRRVVDGRAGEDAERLAVRGREAKQRAERGEEDGREHVEEENDGDRLRDFLIVRVDDGCGRRDGRTAADRRADTHERRDLAGDVQQLVQQPRHDERRRDRHEDDRQRLLAGLPDDGQVHAEAEQDDGVLQYLFRHEGDAGLRRALVVPEQSNDHAGEDAEHRPPTIGNRCPSSQQGTAMTRHTRMPFQFF